MLNAESVKQLKDVADSGNDIAAFVISPQKNRERAVDMLLENLREVVSLCLSSTSERQHNIPLLDISETTTDKEFFFTPALRALTFGKSDLFSYQGREKLGCPEFQKFWDALEQSGMKPFTAISSYWAFAGRIEFSGGVALGPVNSKFTHCTICVSRDDGENFLKR